MMKAKGQGQAPLLSPQGGKTKPSPKGEMEGALIIFIVMVVLNHFTTPTLSDDVLYHFIFQYDESAPVQPIESFSDIITSQWVHYHIINGRIVIHTIIQLILWLMNDHVFHVVNALMFVVLIKVAAPLSSPQGGKTKPYPLGEREGALRRGVRLLTTHLILFTLLFVVMNGFQGEMLWNIGSVNYLWTSVAVLSFLLWMRRIKERPISLKYILLSPLALLVGCTHEGIHFPLSILFLIYMIIHRKTIYKQAVFPFLLFFIAGSVCCMCSPALWSRAGEEGITLQHRLIAGVINFAINIRITWLLLIAIIYGFKFKKALLMQHIRQNKYIYTVLLLTLGVVFVCGTNSDRVGFFADLWASILLVGLSMEYGLARKAKYVIPALGIILTMFIIPAIYYSYENYERVAPLSEPPPAPPRGRAWSSPLGGMRGGLLLAVRGFDADASWLARMLHSRYVQEPVEFGYYIYYQAFDADNLNNRCFAALHHLKRVAFLPEDVLRKIHEDSNAYLDYELDEHGQLYIKRLADDQQVKHIVMKLNEEVEGLWFYQRLLTYPNDEYEVREEQFETLEIEGKRYLVFTKPTTNIYRRIKEIVLL